MTERLGAIVLGMLTFAGYMVGSSRAFGFDASVTMFHFVDGPPSWAVTRQVAFNNHPLFSLIESTRSLTSQAPPR